MVMSASDKSVLIDTSIWIEYFRGKKEVYKKVNELIDSGRVCSLGLLTAPSYDGMRKSEYHTRKLYRAIMARLVRAYQPGQFTITTGY